MSIIFETQRDELTGDPRQNDPVSSMEPLEDLVKKWMSNSANRTLSERKAKLLTAGGRPEDGAGDGRFPPKATDRRVARGEVPVFPLLV